MDLNDLNKGFGGQEESRSINSKAYKSFNTCFICSQHSQQNDITFQLLLLPKVNKNLFFQVADQYFFLQGKLLLKYLLDTLTET